MVSELKISIGQYSDRGRKEINQDFHGAVIPREPTLSAKGIAIALADGISSSDVSQVAAESAVKGFLTDYYCTSDAWSVKTSAHRVLDATNSWLHAQTRRSHYRYDGDKGYVCTFSGMVIKSATAHLFHVGDGRIYRLNGNALEQLTNDHRVAVSSQQSYLSRALGINPQLELDYRAVRLEKGDIFLLATDGIYEYVDDAFMAETIRSNPETLDFAAETLAGEALRRGSPDNLTVQILRIDDLPGRDANEALGELADLPLPPVLEARMVFDGYRILRQVHGSSRSHIYLATDAASDDLFILKIPSIDLRDQPDYLKRFAMEEWVARRINSAHVLKPREQNRRRSYLYVAMEYIEGQTLAQWMIDNPKPDLQTVRGIVEQIARGLQAFHRMEMLHQDLRPENIMIDRTGTVKIIDFGSTRVAGVIETASPSSRSGILGTHQYTAPEYFLGESGSPRSDLFSLGVITYQMLTGRLPYGAAVARTRTQAAQKKLHYASVLHEDRDIPAWIDSVLRKAVQPDPLRRYAELSEYIYDLHHPNKMHLSQPDRPLLERNPVRFWKSVSAVLAVIVAGLLVWIGLHR
ncbi:bifunctional protein-serine/threonine kinase/phosphatase [Ferrovibrio sp.]|uniref:bifunctional protein-serine/threonine kinase/phosphatase n=1 Tax=Ferrovibrio sp. TaxID=1917215 RepID=UPI000CBA022E|nr:bifunctional protein-serine/threonine kinase/phosphatase [Ferrovibrio sp.]PJI42394.1 MAG: protein kinase [Ferrovibrio sp.]